MLTFIMSMSPAVGSFFESSAASLLFLLVKLVHYTM